MLKKVTYTILLIFPFIFSSCNNDLEVIGEWKEVAIVYGLLNPGESLNYVRVEKAFLGEGNALIMAQQHDSIYYGDNISVVLERRKNGQLLSTIMMEKDSSIIKEPGAFTTEGHVVYKTGEKIFSDSDYSLVVHNEQSGYTATAHTAVVDSLTFSNPHPSPLVQTVSWVDNAMVVSWSTGKDSKVFDLVIRFRYGERMPSDLTADTSFIDWRFPQVKSGTLKGGEMLSISIPGEQFYEFVASKLEPPQPDTMVRGAGRLEFIITSGGEHFSTYLDVINANPGISQTTPVYSNINNGLGLFSSRLTQSLSKKMNSLSIDQLACGALTKHLRFLMNNQLDNCPP